MERLANLLALPSVICFVLLVIAGKEINEFSRFAYYSLYTILGLGYVAMRIQKMR